jgi:hypothetical protein
VPGRVLHAVGVYRHASALLTAGAAITCSLTGLMAGWALVRHFQG